MVNIDNGTRTRPVISVYAKNGDSLSNQKQKSNELIVKKWVDNGECEIIGKNKNIITQQNTEKSCPHNEVMLKHVLVFRNVLNIIGLGMSRWNYIVSKIETINNLYIVQININMVSNRDPLYQIAAVTRRFLFDAYGWVAVLNGRICLWF